MTDQELLIAIHAIFSQGQQTQETELARAKAFFITTKLMVVSKLLGYTLAKDTLELVRQLAEKCVKQLDEQQRVEEDVSRD